MHDGVITLSLCGTVHLFIPLRANLPTARRTNSMNATEKIW